MIKFPEIKGCEFYLAVGCVRDTLLGVPFKDKDFVIITKMTFDEVCNAINNLPDSKVYLAKPEFMTIRCRIQGQDIDITWPRTEGGYLDGRHPNSVQIADDLISDAKRRDFTINAMYMDKNGIIFDYFGGQEDLQIRVLKTPTNPRRTFQDDYLRIARLIRFAVTKEFSVDQDTYEAAYYCVPNLVNVPFERIQVELNKALLADPALTLDWLQSLDMLKIVLDKGLHFQLTAKELQ